MAGVNKVILIGNLGKDPELKYTPGGQPLCQFSLATTERFNDKSGQQQKRTEWHNIVVWGKLGELANQYLKKGRSAYIEGKISTRSWDDRDGNKKYRTEIVAREIQFLSSGAPGENRGDDAAVPMPEEQVSAGPAPAGAPTEAIPEDDLPF